PMHKAVALSIYDPDFSLQLAKDLRRTGGFDLAEVSEEVADNLDRYGPHHQARPSQSSHLFIGDMIQNSAFIEPGDEALGRRLTLQRNFLDEVFAPSRRRAQHFDGDAH